MKTIKTGREIWKVRHHPVALRESPFLIPEFLWNNYVFFPKWLNPETHWTPLQCYSFSDILFALISVGIVGVHWALESRPSSLWQRDYLLTSVFCAAHCSHCKATAASEFFCGADGSTTWALPGRYKRLSHWVVGNTSTSLDFESLRWPDWALLSLNCITDGRPVLFQWNVGMGIFWLFFIDKFVPSFFSYLLEIRCFMHFPHWELPKQVKEVSIFLNTLLCCWVEGSTTWS